MSEAAFKMNELLGTIMEPVKAQSFTILVEQLAQETTNRDYLTQKDKIDLIDRINVVDKGLSERIDAVEKNLSSRIDGLTWKLLGGIAVLLAVFAFVSNFFKH